MDLSIIIVNWNSKKFLQKCIDSIQVNTFAVDFEIIVIDSGSYDGCGDMLRQRYPQVRFIQSEQNLGFSRANNKAFLMSRGRYLLFINPDTEVEDCAIQTLINDIELLPKVGAVGPKLLNKDKTLQTTCVRSFPTIVNQILDSEILRKYFPRSRLWGMTPLYEQAEIPTVVDAVSGACLMIKRSVFKDVGMFSKEYFMYSEDIDLCFKLSEESLKTYYIPSATVIHYGGASSSMSRTNIFSDVMVLESRWRFFRKTRSFRYSQLYRISMLTVSLVRLLLLSFILPVFSVSGKEVSIKMALKKWVARLRWTLGFENWVKKY